MPKSIQNKEHLTLRKLLQNTYVHVQNRFEYRKRDVVKQIKVQKITQYPVTGGTRTSFKIISSSYPQYYPYYTKKDSRGRKRRFQRTYRHEYEVVIQLDELSVDTDKFKIRTGRDAKWDFSVKGKSKKDGKGRIIEGSNIQRGINGDHFFRLSWLRWNSGILFGKNYANGPPTKTNKFGIHFLTKHEINVIEVLMNKGILK